MQSTKKVKSNIRQTVRTVPCGSFWPIRSVSFPYLFCPRITEYLNLVSIYTLYFTRVRRLHIGTICMHMCPFYRCLICFFTRMYRIATKTHAQRIVCRPVSLTKYILLSLYHPPPGRYTARMQVTDTTGECRTYSRRRSFHSTPFSSIYVSVPLYIK